MSLHNPWLLLLFLILPLLWFFARKKRTDAAVRFSSIETLKGCPRSIRLRLRAILALLTFATLALLIYALARPREGQEISRISTEGVAMMMVIDRSSSMNERIDFHGREVTNLEAVKKVAADFIMGDDDRLEGRDSDLIGLVTFAGYPEIRCPLVHNHEVLTGFLKETETVKPNSKEDGTAIGDALALAAAKLKKAEAELQSRKLKALGKEQQNNNSNNDKQQASPPPADGEDTLEIKSKVIILLTDGRNNRGEYKPVDAAKLAKEWGIKIYTIGIGSSKPYMTVDGMFGKMRIPTASQLDEPLLNAIAEHTGGFYGKADSAETLKKIYEKIDELEKTKVQSYQYTQYDERFGPWAAAAMGLLLLRIVLANTVLRKIP